MVLLYKQSGSLKEVARQTRRHASTIRNCLLESGVEIKDAYQTRHVPVDIDELKRLYVDEGMGIKEAAAAIGISKTTARMRLIESGVKIRGPQGLRRKSVNIEELARLYIEETMNLGEIAERVGLAADTVGKYLRESGIEIRHGHPKPLPVDTDELKRLYVEEKMTLAEVGALVGLHLTTVRRRLLKAGVQIRTRSDGTATD